MYSQVNNPTVVPQGFALSNASLHVGLETRLSSYFSVSTRVGYGSSFIELGVIYRLPFTF